jgi:hypothetical protein
MENLCPKCHFVVNPDDYFCRNCGQNLKPTPPSISLTDQISLYLKSVLIPPFGIFGAIKYLRQNDGKSKLIGVVAIILTFASLIVYIALYKSFVNNLNNQVNQQLELLGL